MPLVSAKAKFISARKNVTTNAAGNGTFSFSATGTFSGTTISATATNIATGDTSEFSPLSFSNVVTNVNDDGLGSLRTALRVASATGQHVGNFQYPRSISGRRRLHHPASHAASGHH